MRDSRNNYILVGGFLLLMLVALLGWMVLLSGRTGTTDSYYVEFENVMGLSEGAPILFEGYPIGQIEEITFMRNPGHVAYRLNLNIRKGWEIPMDSQAVIAMVFSSRSVCSRNGSMVFRLQVARRALAASRRRRSCIRFSRLS